jgi:quinol monooxygenase YgiN
MNKSASLVTLKAKPGQREEVGRIWEKYARDYVRGSGFAFYYCFDDNDPDRIIVFGLGDQASMQAFAQQPWFPDYQRETSALLAEPGEIRSATPRFMKEAEALIGSS